MSIKNPKKHHPFQIPYRNIAIEFNLMGLSKAAHFTELQNEIASLAKALGHPARVAILEHLLSVDGCVCGDIVQILPLAQATVSQHLKELKSAGLIRGNVEGNSICYCIEETAIKKLLAYFNHTIAIVDQKKNTCC